MFNLYGQVTGVYSENILTINTALGKNQSIGEGQTIEDFERTLRRATGAVYLYDTEKDKVSRIEANEIAVGDMAVSYTHLFQALPKRLQMYPSWFIKKA